MKLQDTEIKDNLSNENIAEEAFQESSKLVNDSADSWRSPERAALGNSGMIGTKLQRS